MRSLTFKVVDDLADIRLDGEDQTNAEELNDLGNPIIDIGRRASEFYKDLSVREESIFNIKTTLIDTIKFAQEGEERRREYTYNHDG